LFWVVGRWQEGRALGSGSEDEWWGVGGGWWGFCCLLNWNQLGGEREGALSES
jgi:hypothetical protein